MSSGKFKGPVDRTALGEFLWLACGICSAGAGDRDLDQGCPPHETAASRYPVHVLISQTDGGWWRYDAIVHELIELPHSGETAAFVRSAAAGWVDVEKGTLIALVAELGVSAAQRLKNHSFVWRDAGVLLGAMSVISHILNLTFRPLSLMATSRWEIYSTAKLFKPQGSRP